MLENTSTQKIVFSQMVWKTAYASQCYKSYALDKVIYLFIEIESFEQKCVIIKGLLQSDWLKQNMVTIGIDQFLTNCAMY